MELQESPGYGSDHPPETVSYHIPVVELALEDGSRLRFRSRVAHPRSSLYRHGQAVEVVYQRSDPATTAEIAGPAVWRSAVLSAVATLALLLLTLLGKACGRGAG